MTGKVARLIKYSIKNEPGQELLTAVLIAGQGMSGDIYCLSEKPLSLFTKEAREWMEVQDKKGLCFHRFKENILLEKIDLKALQAGDKLYIGSAALRVSSVGKRCFKECLLYQEGDGCRLSGEAFFAVTERGGEIHKGDAVYIY